MKERQEDGRFCRAYLRTMDPERAAAEINRRDGYTMLGRKTTQQHLEQMRSAAAATVKREDILRQLAKLAFGGAEDAVRRALERGEVPVLCDPAAAILGELPFDGVVDAILAKRNLGTCITDAPVVVGVGPGFTAGQDCHAVIETMRGHTLGRVIYHGSALPNTGIPGLVGGFAGERVLRAPAAGYFHPLLEIGAQVRQGDTAATVAGVPMLCTLDGILRGILPEGTPVYAGMRAGDIDPRCRLEHCFTASDKALAVGGGVLEAILHLGGMLKM